MARIMKRNAYGVLVLLLLASGAQADSLYNAQNYKALVSDHKAYQVGDNLTVLITETASAATTASTSTNRQSGISGSLLGTESVQSGSVDWQQDFEGAGTIQRSGRVAAQITVRVLEVYPNGDLEISGEQLVEVNDEKQHIKVMGRVRPTDINTNNTVLSSRIGDAEISYVGKGILGQTQKPSLLTRFLTWIGIL